MPPAKQMKVGMIIVYEGQLWRVMSTQIIAPGNWRAFIQTKLRNIATGSQTENRFRTDENIERAALDTRNVEFLYRDGDQFHFMDVSNYEQFHLNPDDLGLVVNYLTANLRLVVQMYEEKAIGVELPQTVKLKVTETDPFMKSATVTNSYKAAKTETGATFQVPGFITEGEVIEIDTASGDYVGRG